MWWFTPVLSALERLRHKNFNFKASLGYLARCCFKKKKKKKVQNSNMT
jgi:hypothetical protein